MDGIRNRCRAASLFLVMLTVFISLPHRYAAAAVVTTEEWVDRNSDPDQNQGKTARDFLQSLIAREEVKEALLSNGISYLEVKHRVDSLSDAEVIELAERIENLPAGGNGVGALIGAVVLIFLVLLITDILGLTDVFPFVKSQGKK